MCDNFPHPWSFYHYLNQHQIMSQHFQKLLNVHKAPCSTFTTPYSNYTTPCVRAYNSENVHVSDSCSSCSSYSSCCSSCSSSSSEHEEEEEVYEDENCDEDESDCEYELNVEAILAMRAAKEDLKRKELEEAAELDSIESSDSKDEESPKSKKKIYLDLKRKELEEAAEQDSTESSDSKDEESPKSKKSRSESTISNITDISTEISEEEFEFVDSASISSSYICPLEACIGGFNRTEEAKNRGKIFEFMYGGQYNDILAQEVSSSLIFQEMCDEYEAPYYPLPYVQIDF